MVRSVVPANPAVWVRISAGSGILISIMGLDICILCVVSCVFSGGSPHILLTTYSGKLAVVLQFSVLVHNLRLHLQAFVSYGHLVLQVPEDVSSTFGRENNRKEEKDLRTTFWKRQFSSCSNYGTWEKSGQNQNTSTEIHFNVETTIYLLGWCIIP